MSMSIRLFTLVVAAAALAGCATPRFQTITRLEPPVDGLGKSCIRGCEQVLKDCRADCQSTWRACVARIEPQVEARYALSLNAYAADLDRYRRELERHEWELWLSWRHAHAGLGYAAWPYPHPYGFVPRPNPPLSKPPTQESARLELREAQCKDDCGCLTRHDTCYLGCGGKLVPETRCVADCSAGHESD